MEQQYSEYCNQVCSVLKKATKKEKASLVDELMDHMESHTEALIELGWDLEEARTYAIQAMGDAETMGRQYDEKLSSFWLWCGRLLRVACILFAALMLDPVIGNWGMMNSHLNARWNPYDHDPEYSGKGNVLWSDKVDISVPTPSGKHVIRVYEVQLIGDSDWSGEWYQAIVSVVSYPKNPFGHTTDLFGYMTIGGLGQGGFSAYNHAYRRLSAEGETGQKPVELLIQRQETDTDIRIEIPLNWEDIP